MSLEAGVRGAAGGMPPGGAELAILSFSGIIPVKIPDRHHRQRLSGCA